MKRRNRKRRPQPLTPDAFRMQTLASREGLLMLVGGQRNTAWEFYLADGRRLLSFCPTSGFYQTTMDRGRCRLSELIRLIRRLMTARAAFTGVEPVDQAEQRAEVAR